MNRNAKKIYIWGLKFCKFRAFSGKFLNFGKFAFVKDLTKIIPVTTISKLKFFSFKPQF